MVDRAGGWRAGGVLLGMCVGLGVAWGEELVWRDACDRLQPHYRVAQGAVHVEVDPEVRHSGSASLRLTGQGGLLLTPALEAAGGAVLACRLFLRGEAAVSLAFVELLDGQVGDPLPGETRLLLPEGGDWLNPVLTLAAEDGGRPTRVAVQLRKEDPDQPLWVGGIEVVRPGGEPAADAAVRIRGWVRAADLRLLMEEGVWEMHAARVFLDREGAGPGAVSIEIQLGALGPPPAPELSGPPASRGAAAAPPQGPVEPPRVTPVGPARSEAAPSPVEEAGRFDPADGSDGRPTLPPSAREPAGPAFANPGFEQDLDASGIPDGWGPAPWITPESIQLARDPAVARSGEASLRLTGSGSAAPAQPLPLSRSGTLRVRAWARQQPGRQPSALGVALYDEQGLLLPDALVVHSFRGMREWQEVVVELPPAVRDPRAAFFDVRLFPNRGEGAENTLWIDDVRVEQHLSDR